MKRYVVDIVETLVRSVEVEAESWQDAEQQVSDLYDKEVYVLDYSNHVDTEFYVQNMDGEEIEG